MTENEFNRNCKLYSKLITSFIDCNTRFYGFKQTITWCFVKYEDISIFAACGEDNVIRVNLLSVIESYSIGDLKQIEYFLLHEIRHLFQNLIIDDFKNNKEIAIDETLVKIWIDEKETYQKAKDKNGLENPSYFMQDVEFDAYAFSLAVMKYKYHDTSDLYVPSLYGEDFYNVVNKWVDVFTNKI